MTDGQRTVRDASKAECSSTRVVSVGVPQPDAF
jgi:hypothetical protein